MRSFLNRLTKVHPTPPPPEDNDQSPILNSAHLPTRNPPIISKQFSLKTQSFSPRPILKQSRKSYINSKHKSLHSDSERESIINFSDKDEIPRRKTMKSSRIHPEGSKRPSEELDVSVRRAQKKREKLAELNSFEVKFNGAKLADKIRKRSVKRSNTLIITAEQHSKRNFRHQSPDILQRPSDGTLVKRPESEKIDFPFFHEEKTFNEPGVSSLNVNFMDGVDQPHHQTRTHLPKVPTEMAASANNPSHNKFNPHLISTPKKGRTRKQRTNYRLRYDEKYKGLKYLIFPDDPFRTRWDLLILAFLIYSAIILPFITAFVDEQVGDVYFCLDITMDVVFFADVVVNLLSAFFKDETLITSHWKIFLNYFTSGWLLIDLSSSIPLDLILEADSQAANGFIRVLKIPRLYKLFKMTRLVRILKIIKERNKILRYFNEVFKLNSGLERVIIAVLLILLFCHIVACLWYIVNDLEADTDYVIWFYMNNLQDLDVLEIYVACLYFTVQTVVTVGYGDVHCYSTFERLFTSGLMIVGVFIYSFAIGSLTSLLSSLDQKNANYSKSLAILAQIKKEYHVNSGLFNKIKNHLKFGQNFEKNHKKLIEELPLSLRTEVIIKMHQEEIHNIPFLHHKPTSFIAFLCPLLKRVKINKNDYIFMRNDPAEEMFFIKSGKVAGVLRKYGNVPFIKIKPGYYFGEVDILFYSNIRRYTFMALKDSEFYVLSLRHFKKIFLVEFRDTIGLEFVQEAYYRKKRTKKIYLEALQVCKANQEPQNKIIGNNVENNNSTPKPKIEIPEIEAKRPVRFKAKESVYNIKGLNFLGLNAEKVLGKMPSQKDAEKDYTKKEDDYFFKDEVKNSEEVSLRESQNMKNSPSIKVEPPKQENNDDENVKDAKDITPKENDKEIVQASQRLKVQVESENSPKARRSLKNFNVKLLLRKSSLDSKDAISISEPKKGFPAALPTPSKKSLAVKTFQKVLNISKLNKRISLGENLKKAAQKEALKEKIRFFTEKINKMDQDINNLINFSRQLQAKYQDKLQNLMPKPVQRNVPPSNSSNEHPRFVSLRKTGKMHTLSHLNFLKSESMKKKHKANALTKQRRKSDTMTTGTAFLTNLNLTLNSKILDKNGATEDNLKKAPLNLRLQKMKDEFEKSKRGGSLDINGRKSERSPSLLLKKKESFLEEGSLLSIEENDLKNSMIKIREKVQKSKNVIENASRRGSEMLSYRGGNNPKSIIGRNIFPGSNEKKVVLDLKPLKRTSSVRRRRSDHFIEASTGFHKNEKGFFIEKTNKSMRKLQKKLTNSEDDEKSKRGSISVYNIKNKNDRGSLENFKSSTFSKTFRNLENVARQNQTNITFNSSKSSKSSSSGSVSKQSQVKSMRSSRRSSIKGINLQTPKMMKIRKSFRPSNQSIISFHDSKSSSDHIFPDKKAFLNDHWLTEGEKHENCKEPATEHEKMLIDGIGTDLILDAGRKIEDRKDFQRKVANIGKLKFMLDLKAQISPNK